MPKKFTTIRIYQEDKNALIDRFGGPTHEAVNKSLNADCPHPEENRNYQTATIGGQRVGGFYCSLCQKYVFKKVQTGQLEPAAA